MRNDAVLGRIFATGTSFAGLRHGTTNLVDHTVSGDTLTLTGSRHATGL